MLTVSESSKFDWKNISLADCAEGNAMDTYFTAKVYLKLIDEVRDKGLEKLYEKLISPLSVAFSEMELEGMLIDQEKLQEIKSDLTRKIEDVEADLKKSPLVPEEINLNSSQQLCKVLFSLVKNSETKEYEVVDGVGFGLYPFEFTAKNQPSTSEETMTKLHSMVEAEYVKRGLNEK